MASAGIFFLTSHHASPLTLCLHLPCSAQGHATRRSSSSSHVVPIAWNALLPLQHLSLTWVDAIHLILTSVLLYQGELLQHSKFVYPYFLSKCPEVSLPTLRYPEASHDSYLNCRFIVCLFKPLIMQLKL